jgi:hypothetical protein
MNNNREYWIDWLRISCSWLIVIYHANRLFDEKGTKIFENHVTRQRIISLRLEIWVVADLFWSGYKNFSCSLVKATTR